MIYFKINNKFIFLLLSIYLILILQLSCKESTTTTSYKLKKAVRALTIFKNNSNFLKEIKDNPGQVKRLFNYIIGLFYDSGKNKKYEEAINKRTINSIDDKKIYLKEIFDNYPTLTDFQKMKIGYFIGIQRRLFFKNYKNSAIKKSIENFIKYSSDSNNIGKVIKLDIWYPKFLNEILLINEQKTYSLLANLDKIYLNLFLQYHQAFHYFFEKNDLKLFKLEENFENFKNNNFATLNFIENSNIKNRATLKFLEEQPETKTITDHINSDEDCMVETQLIIDSLKKNLESVQSNSQEIYKKYNSYIKGVKENKIITSLQNGIKALENKKIEEKEKFNNRAEILNLIVKISKGKETTSDYLDLVNRADKELKIKIFDNPVELIQNIIGLKTHIQEFDKSKSTIHKIAELFLIVGITVTLSSKPLYQKVGKYMKVIGEEINTLHKIISSRVESSLKNYYLDDYDSEGNISRRLPFVSQFFSDFSMDDFVYNQISTSDKLREEFQKNYFSENYEKLKNEFEEIGKKVDEDIQKAHEEGYIDKYSSVGSDWDIGDSGFFSYVNLHEEVDGILGKSINEEQEGIDDKYIDNEDTWISREIDYSDAESVIEKFGEW
jgi:hypothetical protein